MNTLYRIGCAGWSLPRSASASFPKDGSHLQRYAARFNGVEINSSFYRSHRRETYARWADDTPPDFAFSVKLPKSISHEARLMRSGKLLDAFFADVSGLGKKLGCVLIQLPPSLAFDRARVQRFLKAFRERYAGPAVLEPRHETWFDGKADGLLSACGFGRVAADPARVPAAATPGGDSDVVYFRLHGSPKIYYSNYEKPQLREFAEQLRQARGTAREVWCIFDNTALGSATLNAVAMRRTIARWR
jgi:uncharacterized protein YecE (DUF72 family)